MMNCFMFLMQNTVSVLEDYSLRCPSAYILPPYSSMLPDVHLNFQPQRQGKFKVGLPKKVAFELRPKT